MSRVGVELLAGAATAVVFYSEYIGLGAQLDAVWLAEGRGNLGYGNVMALTAAALACLCALLRPGAWLAGPRAASAVVMATSLTHLAARLELDLKAQACAAAIALAAAALTVLLGSLPRMRRWLARLPEALVHAFNFSTAVFIVADGVRRAVLDCAPLAAAGGWALFAAAVVVGVVWQPACAALARRAGLGFVARLTPLGVFAAACLAWSGYALSGLADLPEVAACARGGAQSLQPALVAERAHTVWSTVLAGLPPGVWLAALACGVAVGLVLLLECMTAFASVEGRASAGAVGRVRAMAAANLVGAAAGVGPVSYSAARTHALRLFGGRTRLSVGAHAVCLASLAALAGPWLATIPPFAIGALLVLAGLQLISPDMVQFWRQAYAPQAPARQVRAAVCFWLAVVCALLLDSSLAGFVSGALAWGVLQRAWPAARAQA